MEDPKDVENEDEIDPLALEAYAEMEDEKEPLQKKIDEKKAESEEPEEKEEEPEEEKSEEPSEEESEPKEDEEKETKEEKSEEEKEEEKSEDETEEKPEDDVIRDIAVSESLTIEEAKDRHEGRKGILEKYKNDPSEMAKALQSTQSAYDKAKAENEELKTRPDVDNVQQAAANSAVEISAYVSKNKDALIAKYQEKFPRKSEGMEEDAILEDVTEMVRVKYENHLENQQAEIKSQASKLRDSLITDLGEDNKEFIPEIKSILNSTADVQLVSKAFDIKDIIKFVRGEKYTPEYIKQIEEAAFKRGQEEPKILGEKTVKASGKTVTKKKQVSSKLSERQKDRAQEMFPDQDIESAIKDFKEIYADDLKKNPQFVG